MTIGSLNAADVTVINKGSVVLSEVFGSLKDVTVRQDGSLEITSTGTLSITGGLNTFGNSKTKLSAVSILNRVRV